MSDSDATLQLSPCAVQSPDENNMVSETTAALDVCATTTTTLTSIAQTEQQQQQQQHDNQCREAEFNGFNRLGHQDFVQQSNLEERFKQEREDKNTQLAL